MKGQMQEEWRQKWKQKRTEGWREKRRERRKEVWTESRKEAWIKRCREGCKEGGDRLMGLTAYQSVSLSATHGAPITSWLPSVNDSNRGEEGIDGFMDRWMDGWTHR